MLKTLSLKKSCLYTLSNNLVRALEKALSFRPQKREFKMNTQTPKSTNFIHSFEHRLAVNFDFESAADYTHEHLCSMIDLKTRTNQTRSNALRRARKNEIEFKRAIALINAIDSY